MFGPLARFEKDLGYLVLGDANVHHAGAEVHDLVVGLVLHFQVHHRPADVPGTEHVRNRGQSCRVITGNLFRSGNLATLGVFHGASPPLVVSLPEKLGIIFLVKHPF
ncbi:MAG: hypothetical protein RBG13Loki_1059 [Promethearchaeota archaeon CR_4]|nr:MAG: hypothetical protein RBG13Loki_1059 [Candidatus Lokiarchaeota archaeon CR_4]